MMRTITALGTAAALLFTLAACGSGTGQSASSSNEAKDTGRALVLSDEAITLDGAAISDSETAVTVSHDIVYYRAGMGAEYGEGTEADEHTAEEAEAHTVVTIREAGTYRVSGTLSAGQLAIDLGEDAKTDPEAVVTIVLDGVDITCTVAPAVIFYNVYECDADWVAYDAGEREEYHSSPVVDTSAPGANVVLADGSENNIAGSYVARIYQEGTTKKLHKYDGAVSVTDLQSSADVKKSHVQITVSDVPSEDYSASGIWSEGDAAIAGILQENPGTYQLTVAVFGDDQYTGSSQFQFQIPESE